MLRSGAGSFVIALIYWRVKSCRVFGSAMRTSTAATSARVMAALGRKVPLLSLPAKIPAR